MPHPLSRIKQKLQKELKSIQERREILALEENALFWEECGLWYNLKSNFFLKNKTKSWASFLRETRVPLNTAEFKASLYKKWIAELEYSPDDLIRIHTRKLHRAIPYAKSTKDAEMILKKARSLPLESFLKWLKTKS